MAPPSGPGSAIGRSRRAGPDPGSLSAPGRSGGLLLDQLASDDLAESARRGGGFAGPARVAALGQHGRRDVADRRRDADGTCTVTGIWLTFTSSRSARSSAMSETLTLTRLLALTVCAREADATVLSAAAAAMERRFMTFV